MLVACYVFGFACYDCHCFRVFMFLWFACCDVCFALGLCVLLYHSFGLRVVNVCFALGLSVVLYLAFVLAGPSMTGTCMCCGPPANLAKQTGQAINRFDMLRMASMGALPGPQPQDLRDHRTSAGPHFTHTL